MAQIEGWCVSVSLAALGLVSYRDIVLLSHQMHTMHVNIVPLICVTLCLHATIIYQWRYKPIDYDTQNAQLISLG